MSIIADIIDWSGGKPIFLQEAIGRIIQKNVLSDDDILELTLICKSEQGLTKYQGNLIDLKKVKESLKESDVSNAVSVIKIFSTENINALQNNSEIDIEEKGLTVIYGDNGSGKSSYVSILKQVCNTRGSIPTINKNLFIGSAAQQNQKAKIQYKTGENVASVTWENNNSDSNILKAVHIYDTKSASSYIEDEDEIAFIPSGLLIVEQLANVCNRIEENLRKEIGQIESRKLDYSFLINEEGNGIQTFLKNLSARSDLKTLDNISNFTTDDEKLLKATEQEIAKLKTLDPAQKISENNKIISRFNSLKARYEQILSKLSIEKIEEIKKDVLKSTELQSASKALTEQTFSDLPLKSIGSQPWKVLWESAKRFYQYSESKNFPDHDESSVCPLCLQNLSDEAKERFKNLEAFVQSDIQNQINAIGIKLRQSSQEISSINLNFSEIETTLNELDEISSNFKQRHANQIDTINKYVISVMNLLAGRESPGSFNAQELSIDLIEVIKKIVEKIEEENKTLLQKSYQKDLEAQAKTLSLLKSKKDLSENKEKIKDEIKRQRFVDGLFLCIRTCNTRHISILSNTLSEQYITETLKNNFTDELKRLGFTGVEIVTSTRSRSGKQYHFLELDSSYGSNANLKEILSEGEHRCISLATFLSELSISGHKSSIIFDDPVSSLDHKWRKKIAKRIVEESQERQVIVFTHDITFLMNLQEFDDEIKIQSLTRKKFETGISSKNPPWDALSTKNRIKILKEYLQQLEEAKNTETEEIYKEKSKVFYGQLREAWERCIEEVVLNESVQRFGRSIQTKRLEKVVDLTEEDYKIIEDNMEECSTYLTGHDSAGELIEEAPTIEETKNDLAALEIFTKTIHKRRQ
ncbi:MAG: AAA family ATPase [Patescibacteria group bacterium]|nr:AAA family ATPase [Patescibacteria group bacterium]